MRVWIVEGIGDDNPQAYDLKAGETVGQLLDQFSKKLGVSRDEIEVSTETKRLNNDRLVLTDAVKKGEIIHIMPRAKAGC
jgi:hypothetical protein